MPNQDTPKRGTPAESPSAVGSPLVARPRPAPVAPPVLSRGPVAPPAPREVPLAQAPAPAVGAAQPPAPARPELGRAAELAARIEAQGQALRSGAPLDRGALEALLAEADQVLAELGALAAEVPKGERASIATTRASLLDAAFALTSLIQRLVPAAPAAVPETPAVRPPPAAPAPQPEFQPAAHRPAARGRVLAGLAAVSLLAAAGYHGNAYLERRQALQSQASVLPGTPDGLRAVRQSDGRFLLTRLAGRSPDPGQLERFKALQAARGWKLDDLGQGAWRLEPAPGSPR